MSFLIRVRRVARALNGFGAYLNFRHRYVLHKIIVLRFNIKVY